MKILIVKLSSLGDVVHTLPVLKALRKGLGTTPGGLTIDWLVEEAASGILQGNPLIDEIVVVKRGALLNSPAGGMKTLARLRRKRYDIVLDFQGLFKSGLWVGLSGGKRRIGFANSRELSHLFINEKLAPYDLETHAVDRYLQLASTVGASVEDASEASLYVTGEAKEAIKKILTEGGVKLSRPVVTVVTRARWKTKLWDDEKFSTLVKGLESDMGLDVVLVGSAAERADVERIRERSGTKALNLAGRTSLAELAALLKLSSFVVRKSVV